MQSDLRILVVTPWFPSQANPVSGTFVNQQVSALRSKGISLRILHPLPYTPPLFRFLKNDYRYWASTPRSETVDGTQVDHPRYLTLPRRILFRYVGDFLRRAIRARIRLIFESWPFHVIHAHEAYPTGYAAIRLRNQIFSHIPALLTIHRTSIDDIAKHNHACFVHVRNTLLMADHVIFVSHLGLSQGLDYTHGMIRNKSSLITNGVNPQQFTLDQSETSQADLLRQKYADSFNLLFVGNLSTAKGIPELLSAVREWPSSDKGKLRLFLIGHNLMGRSLNRLLRDPLLRDRVIAVGPVSHANVKIWMSFANAFVLPSHIEGVPTVMFEALFLGLPSIFTSVGGIPYVVRDHEHVLLVRPGSAQELARAIAELQEDGELRSRLGRAGRKLVGENYTWDANAQRTIDVYRQILSKARHKRPASFLPRADHFPPN